MASVLVPVAYIVIVFGGLFIFSYFYRKHTSTQSYEPYFPSHPERNAYITLLQKTDPPASDALLKSALVRRAMADVHRVMRIREDKPALQNLLQKGSIGDDLWNSILNAEKELESEIMEVVAEANSFVEGWGQVIFPTANEMMANEKMRAVFDNIPEARAALELKYDVKSKVPASLTASPAPLPLPKSPNGLTSPLSAGAESIVSSDGEASPLPAKSAKKTKKRK
ncbi:Translocation protein sec66 [Hypsizygus marmoreus]|uniref:Translocation protein sec66 n=1 Tax=Hypsizygus marmoreus TaxID=39966 RepID=A0A369JPI2_HYPMA|nr:Translocation protein sec66 [Hypsizygus marmoreus]